VVVTVDGKLRGAYVTPIHLPAGPHHVRIERAGFFATERDVVVPPSGAVRVGVDLEPTPDTLATYTSSVRTKELWGWVGIVAGAAATAAGIAVLAVDGSDRTSAKTQYDSLTGELTTHTGACNFASGGQPSQCYTPINNAANDYNAALSRDALGYTFLGVGVASLAAGTVLLITAGDPHKYDRTRSAPGTLASVTATPFAFATTSGGFAGLHGSF
jgi:hypothetical protein